MNKRYDFRELKDSILEPPQTQQPTRLLKAPKTQQSTRLLKAVAHAPAAAVKKRLRVEGGAAKERMDRPSRKRGGKVLKRADGGETMGQFFDPETQKKANRKFNSMASTLSDPDARVAAGTGLGAAGGYGLGRAVFGPVGGVLGVAGAVSANKDMKAIERARHLRGYNEDEAQRKKGGRVKRARGGKIRGFAEGGDVPEQPTPYENPPRYSGRGPDWRLLPPDWYKHAQDYILGYPQEFYDYQRSRGADRGGDPYNSNYNPSGPQLEPNAPQKELPHAPDFMGRTFGFPSRQHIQGRDRVKKSPGG
jgi:hypothetical protein